jgi:hypothetical protein
MGQTLSTIVSFVLLYVVKLQEKYEEIFKKDNKKDYYNNDILLKDDGQKASMLILILRYSIKR